MIAIQPYFVFATNEYHKNIIDQYGIAHYYNYCHDFKGLEKILAVPDGCVDIVFEKSSKGLIANACGTVLKSKTLNYKKGNEYYGIRFMPGVLPVNLSISMNELLEKQVDLFLIIKNKDILKKMEEENNWKKCINIFMDNYREEFSKLADKRTLVVDFINYLKYLIIKNKGMIKIETISEYTGYSTRYINKVFKENVGISPKAFNKIIQFQNSIQIINNNLEEKLIDIGLKTGYYDQAHFIREFKKNTEITPSEYRKMVKECNYSKRLDIKKIIKKEYNKK